MNHTNSKTLFRQTFNTNYFLFKNIFTSQVDAAEKSLEIAKQAVEGKYGFLNQETFEKWSLEIYKEYKIGMNVSKNYVMRADKNESWFDPQLVAGSFYWTRYRKYLSDIKNWPAESIEAIDDTTNEVLKSIGDPSSSALFDKRGLVLGYVQSGKTANFTGLINKAFDVGYKLIIVLAGIHNDLRAQTQLRLNHEVIGRIDDEGNPIGVSQIYPNDQTHIISSWTTVDKDISADFSGMSNLNSPTLMAVKKNKTVLESLRDQLIHHKKLYNLDIPVLIVDDEADQASVDTSNPDKNEDPKTINSLIRQILEIFDRKAYAGYTATPFANLLINKDGETQSEGYDLYPKDFLVGLPKPKGYCGPEEFFNIEENPDDPRPSLIRTLEQEDIEVFTPIKKKSDADKFEEVPPQMREAILSFMLSITIRNLRGQREQHNSMLIHTSRFKDVQTSVKDGIISTYNIIAKQLQYNPKSNIIDEFRTLYEEDILPTSIAWPEETPVFSWDVIYEELRLVSKKVQVFEINGNSKDALDYNQYKEKGLYVIAVGGDKLSRGLTLEGLTVTYYFRNTLMYDTLMQMGRWFGFRNGYMDLCRIYTTGEISSNFEHLAIAMIELRQEFDRLAELKQTPAQYAVKMLSHPTMTLTNPLKMRNAELTNIDYSATLQQTRLFDRDEEFYRNNMNATIKLTEKVDFVWSNKTKRKNSYLISNAVDAEIIKEYLISYKTSARADKVDSKKIVDYIDRVNKDRELLEWSVVILEGDAVDRTEKGHLPVKIGRYTINRAVVRGNKVKALPSSEKTLDIRAIVTPSQEYLDIPPSETKGIKDRQLKREKRGKEKGLLLIYPLNPNVDVFRSINVPFSEVLVPIGIGISFPGSDLEIKGNYEINNTIV
ncbi:Z1 domain-containing protein [Bacillus sp. R1-10]